MDPGNAGNPVLIVSDYEESVYGSTRGSATPKARRCPSLAMALQDGRNNQNNPTQARGGGDEFDPEKTPRMGEDMGEAGSQYETDNESQCGAPDKTAYGKPTPPPPLLRRNQSKGSQKCRVTQSERP